MNCQKEGVLSDAIVAAFALDRVITLARLGIDAAGVGSGR